VAGADERDLTQRGMLELMAHADEGPLRLRRRAEHVEHRSALHDELEEIAVRLELLRANVAEQIGGAADVEALLGGNELGERRPQGSEKVVLTRREPRILETAAQERRAELQAGNGLVQVVARPLREPAVDGLLE